MISSKFKGASVALFLLATISPLYPTEFKDLPLGLKEKIFEYAPESHLPEVSRETKNIINNRPELNLAFALEALTRKVPTLSLEDALAEFNKKVEEALKTLSKQHQGISNREPGDILKDIDSILKKGTFSTPEEALKAVEGELNIFDKILHPKISEKERREMLESIAPTLKKFFEVFYVKAREQKILIFSQYQIFYHFAANPNLTLTHFNDFYVQMQKFTDDTKKSWAFQGLGANPNLTSDQFGEFYKQLQKFDEIGKSMALCSLAKNPNLTSDHFRELYNQIQLFTYDWTKSRVLKGLTKNPNLTSDHFAEFYKQVEQLSDQFIKKNVLQALKNNPHMINS